MKEALIHESVTVIIVPRGTSLICGVDDNGVVVGQLGITPRDGFEPMGNFIREIDASYGVVG